MPHQLGGPDAGRAALVGAELGHVIATRSKSACLHQMGPQLASRA
jgi:hypothetical protein